MKSKYLIITLLLVSFLGIERRGLAQELYMRQGLIDLSLTDDLRNDVLMLAGEAEFYWNQLLEPADFDTAQHLQPAYVPIPKSWHKCSLGDGTENLPSSGYATYRFALVVQRGLRPMNYTIKLGTIFSSYRLWLGHLLMAEVGTVGTSRESSSPEYRAREVSFTLVAAPEPQPDTFHVVIQVANFYHVRAGLQEPIYIATQQNMLTSQQRSLHFVSLTLGFCLLCFIIYVIQASLYINNRSIIWLALVATGMAVRIFSTGDRLIASVIPGLSWELLFKLDNISGFCTVPLFSLYFRANYAQEHGHRTNQIICTMGLLISVLVVLLPQRIYGQYKLVYELYLMIGALYLLFWVMLRASFRRRPYALATFVSLGIMVASAVYDALASMGLVEVRNAAVWGIFFFIGIQTVVTTVRHIRVQKLSDSMSGKLQQQASELEVKVEQRVAELRQQQEVLMQHQAREQEENWRNLGVARINDVMVQHKDNFRDLCYHTLTAIIGYVNAKLGCIYLVQPSPEGEPQLEMVACYGLSKEQQERNQRMGINDGLVGVSFSKKQLQHVKDLPQGYIEIASGMGAASPTELLLLPLEFDERVVGVIELASFEPFSDNAVLFVQSVSSVIAANLNNTIMNEQNVRLVKQFEAKEAEMRDTEAQLRSQIEELEAVREEYERMKAHLDDTSAYGD